MLIEIPEGVPTCLVQLDRGTLRTVPQTLMAIGQPAPARCLVIADRRTDAVAGRSLRHGLEAAGHAVVGCVLEDDARGQVEATEEQLGRVVAACERGVCVVLGVGAGVINDLGKLASRRLGKPYVAVPTAASMNGYGSPIAAILSGGAKKTLAAAPTMAIVADLDVIASAPVEMTRSGFADLLSKSTATADWNLAHLVRDQPYDPRPHDLLEPVVQQCQAQAAAIGRADPAALALLMKGLIYGGFSMAIAGHSAPASGGEHLISHLWDMQAHAAKGSASLHGFQVALGTRVVSALYEKLLCLDAEQIHVDRLTARWEPWSRRRQRLRHAHGRLFAAIEPHAREQCLQREALGQELIKIRDRWGLIRETVRPLILPSDRLLELYRAAGVLLDPSAVGQSRRTVRHALLHASDVRSRFTVLDLAGELGVLDPWADSILDEAGIE